MKRLRHAAMLAGAIAILLSGFATFAASTDTAIPRRTPATCPASAPYAYYNTSDLLWHCTDTPAIDHNAAFGGGAFGTTSTPLAKTASGNFLGYWLSTTAATGDTRGIYMRLYVVGAGGGEAGRFYTTVSNATVASGGTVNGAHVSLSATGASAKVSGAGNALRATLDLASSVGAIGGTLAVIRADSNIASGPTIPANTAFLAVDNVGTQKLDYLLNATNVSTTMFANASGTSSAQCAQTGGLVPAKVLKVVIDGTAYAIPLCTQG
jgi:hypothetical protein